MYLVTLGLIARALQIGGYPHPCTLFADRMRIYISALLMILFKTSIYLRSAPAQ